MGRAVLCSVIVSLSPTTFRRQQRADKQIEQLFDAEALFLCDMLTPVLLRSLGGAIRQGGMPAVTVKSEQIVFQMSQVPKALVGQLQQ